MKKFLIVGILLVNFVTTSVWGSAVENLKSRLDKVNSFYANFIQKVTDGSGNIIQEAQGDLWVKRPNQFNWHIIQPEENIMISDGKTLWFYNPIVEQATAIWLKDVTINKIFLMIISNQDKDWRQYNVKQVGDNFKLTPKSINSNSEQFNINISRDGTINKFSTIEQDDQQISYEFNFQRNYVLKASTFNFTPPYGVTVDDQRIK